MTTNADSDFIALQEALAGRYSLQRELGRGGMGIVYLAHEVALDRPVTLKLLPPNLAGEPALAERFMREARTAARLSQPNIVPIHTVDHVENFVFFTMAYVEGESLGAAVRRRGPLPAADAARIVREVAWALAYAHAQGVVHRDVKPDNILLENGSGRALVTDFGIAQVGAGPGLTGRGEVLGTAEFMSPEQASGEPVDERSDIYSLGVVAYYMLTGRLPFGGDTVAAILAKHITQAPPPVASVAPEVPRHLAAAVDRCLAKKPTDRFANGEDLAAALSRSLAVRREIPLPLRAFITQNREQFRGLALWGVFVGWSSLVSVLMVLRTSPSRPRSRRSPRSPSARPHPGCCCAWCGSSRSRVTATASCSSPSRTICKSAATRWRSSGTPRRPGWIAWARACGTGAWARRRSARRSRSSST